MGYQNGGRRYFYRAGSCVFLLFLLVISLTTFLHPASRSEERAPEASLQRGVASSRYDNLSFGIPGKADCIVDREGFPGGQTVSGRIRKSPQEAQQTLTIASPDTIVDTSLPPPTWRFPCKQWRTAFSFPT